MLNKCVFIGRLVRDPELRYTDSGISVTNFTLAVERPFSNSNGEKDVDYIKIVSWRKLAESCAKNLGKGRLVAVAGRLQIRKKRKDASSDYINPEIVANIVKFLDWPANNTGKNHNKGVSESNKDDLKDNGNSNNDYENFDVPF